MHLLTLLSIFRMVVLPVQFQDRELGTTREQQLALVQQAQEYFNRQFAGTGTTFVFELAPAATLQHPAAWYGTNYPDRKDIRLADAVREACLQLKDQVDFAATDNDGDGLIDNIFLLYAGPGEHVSGQESDIYPQQGWMPADGPALLLGGKGVRSFAVAPEGEPGVWCHEFAHALGLPDFYDTDGAESGGECPGLWDTSLMDNGCRAAEFPEFGALEFHLLGLGREEALAVGPQLLQPLASGRRYLRAGTDREDEYFLFEARAGKLYVYHVDLSDNAAGYSARQEKELTARERWASGEINNNPEHPCARLVAADPSATEAAGIPFPNGAATSFGSDTPAAFRAWSGAASGLALTGIRPAADGAVAFEVIRPVTVEDLVVYQDAALVRWSVSPALTVRSYEVSWTDGVTTGRAELPGSAVSYTVEGLQPLTEYTFNVQARCSDSGRYSAGGRFTTKVLRSGTYPYIYLGGATRNLDGSFPSGARIPLRVFNASGVQEVRWTLDGQPVTTDANGWFTLRRSGVLVARILYLDGTSETLLKEISVQ